MSKSARTSWAARRRRVPDEEEGAAGSHANAGHARWCANAHPPVATAHTRSFYSLRIYWIGGLSRGMMSATVLRAIGSSDDVCDGCF